MTKYWTKKRLNTAKSILKKHTSLYGAAQEIGTVLGIEVTVSSLAHAFDRHTDTTAGKFLQYDSSKFSKVWWTKDRLNKAKLILSRSDRISAALAKMTHVFKKKISEDSLRTAFNRGGFGGSLEKHLSPAKKTKRKYIEGSKDDLCAAAVDILGKHHSLAHANEEIKRKLKMSSTSMRKMLKKKFGKAVTPTEFLKRDDGVDADKGILIEKLANIIKRRNKRKTRLAFRDLCDEFDMAPSKMESLVDEALAFGYKITFDNDQFQLDRKIPINKVVTKVTVPSPAKSRVRIGVVSDTHFGSKAALKTELTDFVNVAYNDFGVTTMLHCGDILAGNKVYRGQEAEVDYWGCDGQVEDACNSLPEKKGLEWYGILGNHDISFLKNAGIDVGDKIEKCRSDFHCLGSLKEKIIINGIEIEMAHLKSVAHARSYSLEKHVYRTYSKSNQPHVLFCGHRHANGYFEVQRIHTFLVPCFEDATLFLQYSDFMPSIGGLIVDFILDDDGNIVRVSPTFHLYHHMDEEIETIQIDEVKEKKDGKGKRRKSK